MHVQVFSPDGLLGLLNFGRSVHYTIVIMQYTSNIMCMYDFNKNYNYSNK